MVVLVLISLQVCGQDIITKEKNNRYNYKDERIKQKGLKELIYDSDDSVAIKYYSNYKTETTIGWLLFGTGSVLLLVGVLELGHCIDYDSTTSCNETKATTLWVAGLSLYVLSIIPGLTGQSKLKKSINRFNSIQQSNLKVDINRNGVGLSYNF